MLSNTSGGGAFVDDLSRVYWTYALSLVLFVALAAVLEQVGVPNPVLGYLFVFFTLGAYATIGILARTMQVAEYYAAARRVPAFGNGMATAAGWISGATFLALPGLMFSLGWDGLAFILGLGGGFVLIAVLIAPYLRKFGAYTVPDFLALRFSGLPVRIVSVIVLVSCSFAFLTAQIYAAGLIASRFLAIDFETAVAIALAAIVTSTVLGGMRSLTWTQIAQFIVLIIALLVPAIVMSIELYGHPVPQLALGEALADITRLQTDLVAARLAGEGDIVAHLAPYATLGERNFFALALCLMIGTASMPHVLMRFFTTKSVRSCRSSVAWALLFTMLVLTLAPAYAAFARVEIYGSIIGSSVAALPDWVATYSGLGLVEVYGLDVRSIAAAMSAAVTAIAAGAGDASSVAPVLTGTALDAWSALSEPVRTAVFNAVSEQPAVEASEVWRRAVLSAAVTAGHYDARLPLAEFALDGDAVLIAAPEIAGLPFVFAGVMAAGALAAALSTAGGLLVAMANSFGHDIYYRTLDPHASTAKRLVVSRVLLIVVAVAAAWFAARQPADIFQLVAWSFALAAAGFFPALVLGIWWKRATGIAAAAGMLAGFATAAALLYLTRFAPDLAIASLNMSPVPAAPGAALQTVAGTSAPGTGTGAVGWFGISDYALAIVAVPVGFVVMVIVSLVTPVPSQARGKFVDDIRTPRGLSHMEAERAAERRREFGSA